MIACIASIESREKQLEETVNSLKNQVDHIYVMCNGYLPKFRSGKVSFIQMVEDKGDAAKFWLYCHFPHASRFWLFCDDDLIYPHDYVEQCKIHLFKGGVLSYHGRTIKDRPIQSYYRHSRLQGFRCLGSVKGYHRVDPNGTLGTGVMFFETGISLDWRHFSKNMADIHLAKFAIEQGYSMTVCPHLQDWIRPQEVSEAIFDTYQFDDAKQTELYNSIVF